MMKTIVLVVLFINSKCFAEDDLCSVSKWISAQTKDINIPTLTSRKRLEFYRLKGLVDKNLDEIECFKLKKSHEIIINNKHFEEKLYHINPFKETVDEVKDHSNTLENETGNSENILEDKNSKKEKNRETQKENKTNESSDHNRERNSKDHKSNEKSSEKQKINATKESPEKVNINEKLSNEKGNEKDLSDKEESKTVISKKETNTLETNKEANEMKTDENNYKRNEDLSKERNGSDNQMNTSKEANAIEGRSTEEESNTVKETHTIETNKVKENNTETELTNETNKQIDEMKTDDINYKTNETLTVEVNKSASGMGTPEETIIKETKSVSNEEKETNLNEQSYSKLEESQRTIKKEKKKNPKKDVKQKSKQSKTKDNNVGKTKKSVNRGKTKKKNKKSEGSVTNKNNASSDIKVSESVSGSKTENTTETIVQKSIEQNNEKEATSKECQECTDSAIISGSESSKRIENQNVQESILVTKQETRIEETNLKCRNAFYELILSYTKGNNDLKEKYNLEISTQDKKFHKGQMNDSKMEVKVTKLRVDKDKWTRDNVCYNETLKYMNEKRINNLMVFSTNQNVYKDINSQNREYNNSFAEGNLFVCQKPHLPNNEDLVLRSTYVNPLIERKKDERCRLKMKEHLKMYKSNVMNKKHSRKITSNIEGLLKDLLLKICPRKTSFTCYYNDNVLGGMTNESLDNNLKVLGGKKNESSDNKLNNNTLQSLKKGSETEIVDNPPANNCQSLKPCQTPRPVNISRLLDSQTSKFDELKIKYIKTDQKMIKFLKRNFQQMFNTQTSQFEELKTKYIEKDRRILTFMENNFEKMNKRVDALQMEIHKIQKDLNNCRESQTQMMGIIKACSKRIESPSATDQTRTVLEKLDNITLRLQSFSNKPESDKHNADSKPRNQNKFTKTKDRSKQNKTSFTTKMNFVCEFLQLFGVKMSCAHQKFKKERQIKLIKYEKEIKEDCSEIDGDDRIIQIIPNGNVNLTKEVICRNKSIVILQRVSGKINFTQSWNSYKYGFGILTDSFWVGLEIIYQLMQARKFQLIVDLQDWDNNTYNAIYNRFQIRSELQGYELFVDGYRGNSGDALSPHNQKRFSTFDVDNDEVEMKFGGSCSKRFRGGWWYYSCYKCNPTGVYYDQGKVDNKRFDGISWKTLRSPDYSFKKLVMRIQSI